MAIDTTSIGTAPRTLAPTPVPPTSTVASPGPDVPRLRRPQVGPGVVRYQPAIDGLRAVAVLAVLAYHWPAAWMPGGFLGVEVFFVISGYLITSLLLGERVRTGATDFKAFWLRRARRLLPGRVRLAGGGRRGVGDLAPVRGGQPARGGAGRPGLRVQLVPDRGQAVVLPARRPTVAAAAPVVAGGRGAVLPGLAAGAGRPAAPLPPAHATGAAGHRGAGRRLGGGGHGAVPPRHRPLPGLVRHRHPGLGHPAGRGPGHRRAALAHARPPSSRGVRLLFNLLALWLRGRRGLDVRPRQRVRSVRVPRRVRAARRAHRRPDPVAGAPGGHLVARRSSALARWCGSVAGPTASTCGTGPCSCSPVPAWT